MNLRIIKTDDGSDTLYNKKLDETYHSLHGSVTESKHVYINAGLSSVIDENSKRPISILEVGLGTGLNLLLTLKFAKKNNLKIQYHAIEPFPLDNSILKKLDFNLRSVFIYASKVLAVFTLKRFKILKNLLCEVNH